MLLERRETDVKNLSTALEQITAVRAQIEPALTEQPAVTSLRD